MAATRSKDAGAARADRELTLKAAAELTGCTGKTLRRHIRDGRLRPASMDGSRLTVTLSALRDAGLLPASGAEDHAAVVEAAAEDLTAEREAAERAEAERVAAESDRAERESRQKAEREKADKAKAEKEAREKAEREAAEKARAEKDAREKAEREKAEREKTEREKAEREKADKARAEKDAREKADRERADKARAEKDARERAERERAEREKADKARAEKESREKDARDKAERENAEREKADKARAERESREKAEREREAAKVVPMSRPRPHLEEYDDLAGEIDDDAEDALDERDIAALEGELDDLGEPADSDEELLEAETVRLEAEPRATEARVVSTERGMVVSGSGPWVTSNQLADLMRLLAAEREARSQEWMDRTESLYREMIDSQKLRISSLEEESKALQSKLEDALRLVPKGENVQGLEQVIRDLRIELDRKEAARADLEHERDRLRDLTDRLRNDLSRAEKRNLEMAEQLRRFRAQGIFDRLVGREPDDR